jgi:hypothetical protein
MLSKWIRQMLLAGALAGASEVCAQVVISEFMASNFRTLADEDGDYSDWVELYNAGREEVDLNGWFLTDDAAQLTKWRLPGTNLPPNQHLVIFASGKSRRTAGRPLHTNFKLDPGGEYLGLVEPGGTRVAFAYEPAYPIQVASVSYGVPMSRSESIILPAQSPARLLIPSDDSTGSDWTLPEYDDSAWLQATTAVAYATSPRSASIPVPVASSARQFSGLQGQDNWYYGYYDKAADPVTGYAVTDFTLFPRSDGPASAANYWNGTSWDWFGGDPPWVEIGERYMQPNGSNSGKELWAIRRWVSPVAGTLTVQWHLAKQTPMGSGVTARLYQNGELKGFILLEGNDLDGIAKTNILTGTQVGDRLDFAVLPVGIATASDDRGDGCYLDATIWAEQGLGRLIQTDVAGTMRQVNSSIYARLPFVLTDPGQFSFLALRLRFADGFAAYLNGVLVAAESVPAPLSWDSAATEPRSLEEAVRIVDYDLTPYLGLLHEGTNVLALQGLTASAGAEDFLLEPELRATQLKLDLAARRYFTLPSPGTINGFGNLKLGPLIRDVAHSPSEPRTNETLVITARVARSFNSVTEVTLAYRVMFGAEARVRMADDGQHEDGAAGDGVYGASIPGAALAVPGQMVRYYIAALDSSGNLSRSPAFPDPLNSPQYYGAVSADPALTNRLPVLHWFVEKPASADTAAGARCSVYYAGEFYDNLRAYVHGQSSLEFPKKSYNFHFNTGYSLRFDPAEHRVHGFNLLTTYPDKAHMRNILSYDTFRAAGSPNHVAFAIRVQRNAAFFSDAHYVENGDEDSLARLGLNPEGALYKMYNNLNSSTSGAEKKTRKNEKNTDLQALINGVQLTGTARTRFLYDNIDIAEMVNYLAAIGITGNVDYGHKNYYMYRDTGGTDLWQMLPWDVDLSFGRNWTGTKTYYDDAMYSGNPLFVSNGNLLIDALGNLTVIKQMFGRRIRTLMDELMQPTNTPPAELKFERRIAELAALIGPDAALDYAKWPTWGVKQTLPNAVALMITNYFPARRNFLFRSQTSGSNPLVPGPQPTNAVLVFGTFEVTPATGKQEQEYIQLLNRNTYAVDISGWRLAGGITHSFHPGTVLPANGALYLTPSVAAFRTRPASPKGGEGLFVQGNYRGQLSARGDTLRLLDQERLVATLTWPGQPSPAQQYLRVVELMYHPPPPPVAGRFAGADFEYVILKNTGAAALDLAGVHFTNGIMFQFTGSAVTNLAPGQSVAIAANLEAFAARYGAGTPVAGAYTGSLDNAGERLRLDDALGEVVLDFSYQRDWYPLTDGKGLSLTVANDAAPWSAWGEKATWRPSSIVTGESLADWKVAHFSPLELAQPGVSGDQIDLDGDGFTNWEEFLAGTNPRDPTSRLRLSAAGRTDGADSHVRLQFEAAIGRSYTIQFRDSLTSGPWQKATDVLPQSAAGTVLAEAPGPEVRTRFYRLVTPRQP